MEVKPEHIDVLLNLAVSHYDFVILDVGRQLDAVTIKALDRAEKIFPVLQTTLPFMRDASRLLSVFRSLGYPLAKVGLVVNRYEKGGEIALDDVEPFARRQRHAHDPEQLRGGGGIGQPGPADRGDRAQQSRRDESPRTSSRSRCCRRPSTPRAGSRASCGAVEPRGRSARQTAKRYR